jgi:hypothetical protein
MVAGEERQAQLRGTRVDTWGWVPNWSLVWAAHGMGIQSGGLLACCRDGRICESVKSAEASKGTERRSNVISFITPLLVVGCYAVRQPTDRVVTTRRVLFAFVFSSR